MRGQPEYGTDEVFTSQADWLHVSFYACTVCGAIYLLLLLCLRSRIAIAVRVMKEATRAVGALPLMLMLPLLTLGLVVGLLAYGLIVLLLLISCGELQYGRSGFGARRKRRTRGDHFFLPSPAHVQERHRLAACSSSPTPRLPWASESYRQS